MRWFSRLPESFKNQTGEIEGFQLISHARYGDHQVEEFVAFYISNQISPNTWTSFKGYDPLNPVCLRIWFRDHNLDYSALNAFPTRLESTAKLNEGTCYTRTDSSKSLALVAVPVK